MSALINDLQLIKRLFCHIPIQLTYLAYTEDQRTLRR